MSPKRIQMSRQHPWRADNPDAVIVDRTTRWGNPFRLDRGRGIAVAAFRDMLADDYGRNFYGFPSDTRIRFELGGRDLACWCPPDEPCHADVLIEIANPTT